jgi:Holliday junction resolvase RusA-like endonuclease
MRVKHNSTYTIYDAPHVSNHVHAHNTIHKMVLNSIKVKVKVKVKFTLEQATKAQRYNSTLSLTSALEGGA